MTRKLSPALQTLIEIATKESKKAADNLSIANRQLQDGQKNLSMLMDYRKDYEARLTNHLKTGGVSTENYFNFQSFLKKIDVAILGQQNTLSDIRQQLDFHRKNWQEHERKKLSYSVVVSNSQKRAHQHALKKDQKLMDEHASRLNKNPVR